MRKRHALGTVHLDIYEEFSQEMTSRRDAIISELEKLDKKISNPKDLIHFACNLTSKLAQVWHSSDYYQKQTFQNTLFPKGLSFNSKNNTYRTLEVNNVISCIAALSKELGKNKNRISQKI
ncbi:MAG: hypothetical protein M0D57_10650 [Sphingobacteriales bacterium JAD_PAG50586_3]|nr:MAG: hypothetical protein M0D57_10650 [Sphingobacteriales bacterium JAD_PAG50586_3]